MPEIMKEVQVPLCVANIRSYEFPQLTRDLMCPLQYRTATASENPSNPKDSKTDKKRKGWRRKVGGKVCFQKLSWPLPSGQIRGIFNSR
jgi:hypothetical protein